MSKIALTTGLRALLSSQFALNTVGQNIANANTPGYTRQKVVLAASNPILQRGLMLGNGVDVRGVNRTIDQLLERRILGQIQVQGSLNAQLGTAQEIEGLFGEPGGFGISGALDGMFSSFNQLSGNPADPILRTAAVQSAVDLAARFNGLDRSLDNVRAEVGKELAILSQQVNQLGAQVAKLNGEISQAEAAGLAANDLRDQRQVVLGQLAELVDVGVQEDESGSVRVLVSGNVLVNRETSRAMGVKPDANGQPRITIAGVGGFVPIRGGRMGGLISLREGFADGLRGRLDSLARNLILEMNRIHSQGIPASGSFRSLLGANAVQDMDGDGDRTDELLSKSGLPFEATAGAFYINVIADETGAVSKHRIDIDPARTTVGDVIEAIESIGNLTAGLDASGRLQMVADAGFSFDFSNRVDPKPDTFGTFGSAKASIGGTVAGPFPITPGSNVQIAVPGGPGSTVVDVAFASADFVDPSNATAEEVVHALNQASAFQAAGLQASVVDGRVFLQSAGTGPSESFVITGGSALASIGWNGFAGTAVSGSVSAVAPEIGGAYSGTATERFVLVPVGNGTVGTTPNLSVEVFNSKGELVKTLSVGAGYQPGESLELFDGLTVAFQLGELSQSLGDRMELEVVGDSDTADALVALGLNSLFVGGDARTIALRKDIEIDPRLLAASGTGAEGDNRTLLALLGVEDLRMGGLGGATVGESYGAIVGDLGFEVKALADGASASGKVLESLELRRQSISGVNVDEELVDMVRFEQAFAAASQLIRVVNEMNDELLRIL